MSSDRELCDLSKLLNLLKPHFPHILNEDNITYLVGLNGYIEVELLEQGLSRNKPLMLATVITAATCTPVVQQRKP